ncbi:865_t:CDS:1, partial [Gigaspora margarita]
MGDIPFTCSNSYNYSSLSLYTTCQIRKCNLIFIWLFPTLVVLSIIVSNIDSDDYDGNYSTRISNVAETPDNNISNASDVRNDSTVANNVVEVHVPNASDVNIIPNASDMEIIPNASDVKIIPNASDVIS